MGEGSVHSGTLRLWERVEFRLRQRAMLRLTVVEVLGVFVECAHHGTGDGVGQTRQQHQHAVVRNYSTTRATRNIR